MDYHTALELTGLTVVIAICGIPALVWALATLRPHAALTGAIGKSIKSLTAPATRRATVAVSRRRRPSGIANSAA